MSTKCLNLRIWQNIKQWQCFTLGHQHNIKDIAPKSGALFQGHVFEYSDINSCEFQTKFSRRSGIKIQLIVIAVKYMDNCSQQGDVKTPDIHIN